MKTSEKGINLIKSFESFSSKPYLCPAGRATIGYGSTYYSDGSKVKMTDKPITLEQAKALFSITLKAYELCVSKNCVVNQNQYDALVSFTYNVGVGNFQASTLLKKVKINPSDPTIRNEFKKWNRGGEKVLAGLTRRRDEEADLYFST